MANHKILIGSDHAGFDLKQVIIEYLKSLGLDVTDIGAFSKDSCHYPTVAKDMAQKIIADNDCMGILICGTGIGMSIAANRYKGIRAAVLSDVTSAKLTRLHNNSNILCFGSRIIGEELAKDIVYTWLNTEFLGGRHQQRLDLIDN